MRFQAVELSPIFFEAGKGWMMVACVAWVAWRSKQGETMEFSCEELTDRNQKKQGFEMALELACDLTYMLLMLCDFRR